MTGTGRITHLDSLRGLAALIVVFHHCLVTFPAFWSVYQRPATAPLMRLLGNAPLHLLRGGPEFVLVFFTLSGFVLSLPYWNDKPLTYGQFVIRRVFRTDPTYLVAMLLSSFRVEVTLAAFSLPCLPGIALGHRYSQSRARGLTMRAEAVDTAPP